MPTPRLPRYNDDRHTVARRNNLMNRRFGRGLAGIGIGLCLGLASLWTGPAWDKWLLGAFTVLALYHCIGMIKTAWRLRRIDDTGHITRPDSDKTR